MQKFRFLLVVLFLISASKSFCQNEIEQSTLNSEKSFNAIHQLFEERYLIFKNKKIKLKQPFIDSLFVVQKWAKKNGTSNQQLIADYQVFFGYNQTINNDKIIETGTQLLADKKFLDFPKSAYVAREVVTAYYRKGFYRKQLEFYPLFKRLNKKHNYNVREATYLDYQVVAMIYYRTENYKKARDNFKLQRDNYIANTDYFRAGSMQNNIGLTYEKENSFIDAKKNYKTALELLAKDFKNDPFFTKDYKKHFKNVVASNLATLQLRNLDFDGIETIFLNELVSSKMVNEPRTTIQAYINLGEYYLLQNKINLSKQYTDSAIVLEKNYNYPSLKSRAYHLKAKYLLSSNEVKQAQLFFLKSKSIDDSIQKVQKEKSFEEASLAFNLDVVEEELEMSKELLDQKNKTEWYQWILLIVAGFAIIIFLYQYIRIKRKNKSIIKNDKELSKALKNNQTLLDEIHHRIKNNLQIISGILDLKSSKLIDEKNASIFQEIQKYIESMSYIHEHLYAQEAKTVIDMDEYLKNLTDAVVSNYNNKNITIVTNAKHIVMTTDNATPLGLIVCELVTNSAKHAFENRGKIDIKLTKEINQIHFYYKDDGKGFDIKQKSKAGQIGVNLMNMLIEELEADKKEFIDNGYHLKLIFNETI